MPIHCRECNGIATHSDTRVAKYCEEHAKSGMKHWRLNIKCAYEGCNNTPRYGLYKDNPFLCKIHKTDDCIYIRFYICECGKMGKYAEKGKPQCLACHNKSLAARGIKIIKFKPRKRTKATNLHPAIFSEFSSNKGSEIAFDLVMSGIIA